MGEKWLCLIWAPHLVSGYEGAELTLHLDVQADIQRLIRQLNYLSDPSLVPHALRGVADTGFSGIILTHLLSEALLEHLGLSTQILCRLSLLTRIISQSPPTVGNWQAWSPWRFVFTGSSGWGPLLFLQRDSDEDMRWNTFPTHSCQGYRGKVEKWCR